MGLPGSPPHRHGLRLSLKRGALGTLLLSLVVGCSVDHRPVDTLPSSGTAAATPSDTRALDMMAAPSTPGSGPTELTGNALSNPVELAPGVTPLGDGAACLSESRGMELRPLALYVMLDSSGSMLESTGTIRTKWDAVQLALRRFLVETEDEDLLLGMQFFPLLKAGTKFVCTSEADCGAAGGPCFLSTCVNASTITLCRTEADCDASAGANPCVKFGLCSMSDPAAPIACVLPSTCADGMGVCQDFERTCTNATSCDPSAYATPAVEIQSASAGLAAIDQALRGRQPEGLTPTVPALQGALDHARAWAQAHPNQTVAVLLATDGLPTECADKPVGAPTSTASPSGGTEIIQEVLKIAAAGMAATTAIPTYVIGVFRPSDSASIDNVNAIAQAGGTDKAAFIDASGQVEDTFLAALRGVKEAAAPCQLRLADARGLDFSRADLLFDAGSGAPSPLPYVDGLLGCASKPEAWFYDVTPAQGTPSAVQLCPNLCQLVKSSPMAGLSLQIGCAGR
jgi:hypothetical protein